MDEAREVDGEVLTGGTELAVIRATTAVLVFSTPGGVDDVLSRIKSEIATFEGDISTPKGRAAIRALAYKVARSKTALDGMGKELTEDLRRQKDLVDADRRRIREALDELAEQVRKPLTDWENKEKQRVADHEAALAALVEGPLYGATETAEEIRLRLGLLMNPAPGRDWQEFEGRFQKVLAGEIARMKVILATVEKREADAAEAERVRLAEEARLQKEHEDRIAQEAAERARLAAEEKAEQDRLATAAAAKVENDRIQAEKDAEEKRRKDAEEALEASRERERQAEINRESARVAAHEMALKSIRGMISDALSPMNSSAMIVHIRDLIETMPDLKRDWEEFRPKFEEMIEQGRRDIQLRFEVVTGHEADRKKKAEQERADEIERTRLKAAEDEKKRLADEKAAEDAETASREADKAHRSRINGAALVALERACAEKGAPISTDQGKAIITAIVKGLVPAVRISY